jgi:hypothetical protein
MEDWNVGVMEKTTICSFTHYSIILLFHHSTLSQNLTPETRNQKPKTRHFFTGGNRRNRAFKNSVFSPFAPVQSPPRLFGIFFHKDFIINPPGP